MYKGILTDITLVSYAGTMLQSAHSMMAELSMLLLVMTSAVRLYQAIFPPKAKEHELKD